LNSPQAQKSGLLLAKRSSNQNMLNNKKLDDDFVEPEEENEITL